MSFPSDRTTFLTQFPVSVCSCLHSFPSLARPNVQIIRYVPTASALVQGMLRYFFTKLWPAFRHLGQTTTTTPLGGVSGSTVSRLQPALPLFVPPEFREPRVRVCACGCPAPYHTPRHQLVPCSVKSVLGFRAVQLAHRFTLRCPCLASRLCVIAFFSHSLTYVTLTLSPTLQ